jgi:hypothetical protein
MTCICVLGMHRSGTSCLTGIMQRFGVELGDVFTENLYNKRGNRENSRIVDLNEALLTLNKATWYSPTAVTKWHQEHIQERDSIIAELRERTAEFWGFKDTRTLFTLNFWLDAIEQPKFIGTFRHPHRVALSLNKRDNAPVDQCWDLWHVYNTRLLELAAQYQFSLVNFDLPPAEYLDDTLSKLLDLGLDPENEESARGFFDSSLRNQAESPVDNIKLPAHVVTLYEELLDYNANYKARA